MMVIFRSFFHLIVRILRWGVYLLIKYIL
jgi:hypothetical protein